MSSPPIAIYTPVRPCLFFCVLRSSNVISFRIRPPQENIDEELHIAAERYLQNMVDIRLPNSVVLPRCFKWFAKVSPTFPRSPLLLIVSQDFGQTKAQVLRFVAQYLQEPQKQQLLEMAKNPAGVNMQYAEYDWRLWMKQVLSGLSWPTVSSPSPLRCFFLTGPTSARSGPILHCPRLCRHVGQAAQRDIECRTWEKCASFFHFRNSCV